MLFKNSFKPLELVVSAIHSLREKKGSSPQNILRFLVGKYNLDTETLKPHIQNGLKRGITFGMITHRSGLYRLNNILANPLVLAKLKKTQRLKLHKRKKPADKRKLRHVIGKKGKRRHYKCAPAKNKRKKQKTKNKRKKIGGTPRRFHVEMRRRKQKTHKTKVKKLWRKTDKAKKVINENQQSKVNYESQKTENAKEGEAPKTIVQT